MFSFCLRWRGLSQLWVTLCGGVGSHLPRRRRKQEWIIYTNPCFKACWSLSSSAGTCTKMVSLFTPKPEGVLSSPYLNRSIRAWRKVRKLLCRLMEVSSSKAMFPNTCHGKQRGFSQAQRVELESKAGKEFVLGSQELESFLC